MAGGINSSVSVSLGILVPPSFHCTSARWLVCHQKGGGGTAHRDAVRDPSPFLTWARPGITVSGPASLSLSGMSNQLPSEQYAPWQDTVRDNVYARLRQGLPGVKPGPEGHEPKS